MRSEANKGPVFRLWQKYYFFAFSCQDMTPSFHMLPQADSTNNYAMDRIREGLAVGGSAWFSANQTAGKGQRGRVWASDPGLNMALSVVIQPEGYLKSGKFHLNALVGLSCLYFLRSLHPDGFSLKWPNDLYWNDRKAGGILIESVMSGTERKWIVAGIGININQLFFPGVAGKPVSIKEITGQEYDPESLARALHKKLLFDLSHMAEEAIMKSYNEELYMRGQLVKLKKGNVVFSTKIREVNEYGHLLSIDATEHSFSVGEVEWL